MKKRYKGYFKKPTNLSENFVRNYIQMKRGYSNNEKFRLRLWLKLYLSEIKCDKLVDTP